MKNKRNKFCSAIVTQNKEYPTSRKNFLHQLSECVRDRQLTNALELLENRGYTGEHAILMLRLVQGGTR